MIRFVTPALVASVALAGCASTPDAPAGPPDFTPIAATPAPRAALYADCIAQAAAAGRYGHAHDGLHVIIFTCEGRPAQTFFDALADFSAANDTQVTTGDRVMRATTKIERDLFGADYCEHRGSTYSCSITLRTGEFVIE